MSDVDSALAVIDAFDGWAYQDIAWRLDLQSTVQAPPNAYPEPRTDRSTGNYVVGQYEIFCNPTGCPDGIFSKGGDSGSLVLKSDSQTAVGLLWGGNPTGGIRAMMSDITVVEARLGVTVAWSA